MLSVRPDLSRTLYDYDYYLELFYDGHDGEPYYDAVARIWLADKDVRHLPIGVTSYRLPTLFYFWHLLPATGNALIWGFLVFAAVAVGSAFSIGAQLSRPGIAVLGALMVAVAYLFLATGTFVTFVDGWAMALTLAGTAFLIASVRRESRGLLWLSLFALFAGAAIRELLLYPVLITAASVVMLPKGTRWREVWPWLAGVSVFAAAYAAHVVAIAGRVDPNVSYSYWFNGGPSHLLATLRFFETFFGGGAWLVPVLVFVGIAGAMSVYRDQARLAVILTAMTAAPLAAFLIFGSGAPALETGLTSGYWAMLVVPTALALVPVALHRVIRALPAEGTAAD